MPTLTPIHNRLSACVFQNVPHKQCEVIDLLLAVWILVIARLTTVQIQVSYEVHTLAIRLHFLHCTVNWTFLKDPSTFKQGKHN